MNDNDGMSDNMGDMGGCSMRMYFHFGFGGDNECILLKHWSPDNLSTFLLSCFVIFILCIIREFIIYIQKYYEVSTLSDQAVPFWSTKSKLDKHSTVSAEDVYVTSPSHSADNAELITIKSSIINCILYGCSLLLGYCLMLVAMTFNVVLIIIIIFGHCSGRFVFYRQTILLRRFAGIGIGKK
eukprot:98696_1